MNLWTKEELDKVRLLYEAGGRDADIAVAVGRSKYSVESARFKFGIRRPADRYLLGKPWSLADIGRARGLYAAGAGRKEMARLFGRTETAIKRFVTNFGLQRNPHATIDPSQFDTLDEAWKASHVSPRYAASSAGRIMSLVPGKIGNILSPWTDDDGYEHVSLRLNGRLKRIAVHKLILFAFRGPPPTERHQSAHWDGIPGNNRLDNLRWATGAENQADRLIHGTAQRRPDGRFMPSEFQGVSR